MRIPTLPFLNKGLFLASYPAPTPASGHLQYNEAQEGLVYVSQVQHACVLTYCNLGNFRAKRVKFSFPKIFIHYKSFICVQLLACVENILYV